MLIDLLKVDIWHLVISYIDMCMDLAIDRYLKLYIETFNYNTYSKQCIANYN